MWSRWLYEIENYCIEAASIKGPKNNFISDKDDIQLILDLADKTNETYNKIIKTLSKNFDCELTNIFFKIHTLVFNYMKDKIIHLEGLKYIEVFPKIVDDLVIVMQHTLLELHEIDAILNTHGEFVPFISIDDLSINYFKHFGKCLIVEKIKIYQTFFDIKKVYFKNYTDKPLPEEILENVHAIGVEIDYKKCMMT